MCRSNLSKLVLVYWLFATALLLGTMSSPLSADEPAAKGDANRVSKDVLSPKEWKQLDQAVDRGLEFLASKQNRDGSFETIPAGQPAVTSLCVLAFLSRGHLPGNGPYGEQLDRAISFVVSCQQRDGAFSYMRPLTNEVSAKSTYYNHAISGLMLSEAYGMTETKHHKRIRQAIIKAIPYARRGQVVRKTDPRNKGGWRYLRRDALHEADLSITSWFLMFYRSARNAEFDVPKQYVDDAMAYVRRCFYVRKGGFVYRITRRDRAIATRGGVMGGGIVSLSLGGEHQSEMAQTAGKWILNHSFDHYNRTPHIKDRYHYSAFYCSQAMYQLGGEYWSKFYPRLMRTLVANQRSDGSWAQELRRDMEYGNIYTSALTVLALTPPYQLLPIFQR